MPISTSQFNDLVKNAMVMWREEYNSVEENARQLYDIVPNENLTSEYSHIDSPGFARRKDEGGNYVIGSPRQGYTLKNLGLAVVKLLANSVNCWKLSLRQSAAKLRCKIGEGSETIIGDSYWSMV